MRSNFNQSIDKLESFHRYRAKINQVDRILNISLEYCCWKENIYINHPPRMIESLCFFLKSLKWHICLLLMEHFVFFFVYALENRVMFEFINKINKPPISLFNGCSTILPILIHVKQYGSRFDFLISFENLVTKSYVGFLLIFYAIFYMRILTWQIEIIIMIYKHWH